MAVTFYVTYGHGSNLRDCYSVVEGEDYAECRRILHEAIGDNFAFMYSEEEFAGQVEDYNLRKVELQPHVFNIDEVMNSQFEDILQEIENREDSFRAANKFAIDKLMHKAGIDPEEYDLYLPAEWERSMLEHVQYLPSYVKFHPLIKEPLAMLRNNPYTREFK